MNKVTVKIRLLLFCVCAAPLFQACESDFLKSAMETLNPSPKVFVGMKWSDSNEIYLNPNDASIAGTMGVVSGIFLNGGKRVWPIHDLKDNGAKGKRAWSIKSHDEENYPASTITSILESNDSPSTETINGIPGDTITLIFESGPGVVEITDPDSYPPEGVTYSFILTPNAFYGADIAALSTDTLTREFKLIKPTSTVYGKHWLERYMYGTVSTSWAEGTLGASLVGTDAASVMAAMVADAGSKAAVYAEERLNAYAYTEAGSLTFAFDNESAGSMSVVSWENTPDLSLGWASLKSYALALSPIRDEIEEEEEPFAPVSISVPVLFTSNVGFVVSAVKDAMAAGTFGQDPEDEPTVTDNTTGYPAYIQHLGDIADLAGTASGNAAVLYMIEKLLDPESSNSGDDVDAFLNVPQVECSPLENKTSAQTLTIVFGPGTDGSPTNTLTFKVWVKEAEPPEPVEPVDEPTEEPAESV
jgi:hypothetical protein